MSDIVKIGDHYIGGGYPCFIIAEAGVNHNSRTDLAKKLILEAKKCGANCVKFQTFKAERVVTKNAPKADYQLKTTDPVESQVDMLKKLELDPSAYSDLIALCKREDILFMSTPVNIEDADFLNALGVPAFKLPSMSVSELYLLQHVAKMGKPIILSTGMSTLAEVDEAVRAIRDAGNNQIVLLQCTTNYPSRHEDANLLSMQTMHCAFDVTVGYSDHTEDNVACIASVALGAKIIEKHFTLDKAMSGPDHSCSASPEEMLRLVTDIRSTERALGSHVKSLCAVEVKNAVGMRRSIVAKHHINSGEIITKNMLTFKRPSGGLLPKYFDEIVGKRARHNMEEDHQLSWSDIE